MIERGKLEFEQCFNGSTVGVYFKIGRKLEVAYFKEDIETLEKSIEMMLKLKYLTVKKYQMIKDDIDAFKRVMNQPRTLTDGRNRGGTKKRGW